MKAEIRESGGVAVVGLRGRITLEDGAESLRRLIRDLLARNHAAVVLDLRRVSEVDSGGLAAMIACQEEIGGRGGVLKLACLSKPLLQVLRVTRLHLRFETFRDETDAVRSFQTWPSPALRLVA
jgi:anti-sigma B factor antagonist